MFCIRIFTKMDMMKQDKKQMKGEKNEKEIINN